MDCQENWSKEIWDVYEFTINFSKDSEKIESKSKLEDFRLIVLFLMDKPLNIGGRIRQNTFSDI